MKTISVILITTALIFGSAYAAGIDGKWFSEQKMERDGQSFTITRTFEFKTDGSKLAGTVTMAFGGMDPITSEIKDGKIEGNSFSFTVTVSTPNGEMKSTYSGTVEGDVLKGTTTREGGQPRPFEAKRK